MLYTWEEGKIINAAPLRATARACTLVGDSGERYTMEHFSALNQGGVLLTWVAPPQREHNIAGLFKRTSNGAQHLVAW